MRCVRMDVFVFYRLCDDSWCVATGEFRQFGYLQCNLNQRLEHFACQTQHILFLIRIDVQSAAYERKKSRHYCLEIVSCERICYAYLTVAPELPVPLKRMTMRLPSSNTIRRPLTKIHKNNWRVNVCVKRLLQLLFFFRHTCLVETDLSTGSV